ncbi:MAG: hypothetical protein EA356_02415 [Geminicoccaceae bacterium]|nr:MAG: hypothetical protein EA356_02415 [Geminicoccaceae bacterium]
MDIDDPHLVIRAAGAEAAAGLAAALALRAEVLAMTAKSRRSVLAPAEPGGLAPALRLGLAVRMAAANAEPGLEAAYRALGEVDAAVADAAGALPAAARLGALVRHVDLVTERPRAATAADIAALGAAGWDTADIVRLSQLVAFVSYEVRLVRGLRLMAEHGRKGVAA